MENKFIDKLESYNELVYIVLTRYREIMGKDVYTERPRTDLQEAMQNLEKFYPKDVKD